MRSEDLCGAVGDVRDMGFCYCTRIEDHAGDHGCVHGEWGAA